MSESSHDNNRVNTIIGEVAGIAGIPIAQLIYIVGFAVFMLPFFFRNPTLVFFIFIIVITIWLILSWDDPAGFFERWTRVRKLYAAEEEVIFNKAGIPRPHQPRQKSMQLRLKGKRIQMTRIESQFELLTYGQIELDGYVIGYYLLQRGPRLMFIFAFDTSGLDPAMTTEQARLQLTAINTAVAQLPYSVALKGFDDLFCDSATYVGLQQSLKELPDITSLEKGLIASRQKKAQDLGRDGRLLKKSLTIFAKYIVPLGTKAEFKRNALERLLSDIAPALGMGQREASPDRWAETIKLAYDNAWQAVYTLLSSATGFGMQVRALSAQEMFKRDWDELHNEPAPAVPQLLVYDQFGLHDPIINGPIDALGTLFSSEHGYPGVPEFGDSVIYCPTKDKYLGFLRVGLVESFPPEIGGSVPLGKIRYLLNILTHGESPIYDYRVVWELARIDSMAERINLDRQISASVKQEAYAIQKGTINVVAMRRREQAVEARDQIEQNNPPCWMSLGIWLYRDSAEQLNNDLNNLAKYFTTAKVERSWHTTQDHWMLSWPFAWSPLLTKPMLRQQKYLSKDAIPQLPLIKPPKLDKNGVLLIHKETRTPCYLDIVKVVPNHTAVLGFTGAGKSVFMGELAIEPIIRNNPLVVFDFPAEEGRSTFTPLVETARDCGKRAANYDVRRQRMNPIELPDMRRLQHILSPKEYQERVDDVLADHVYLLTTLVLGASPQPGEIEDVSLQLSRAYSAFHANSIIANRYKVAINAGFGGSGYGEMPILEDFVKFAQGWYAFELERDKSVTDYSRQVVDKIMSRLKGRLDTALGRSLNGLSSFSLETDVLVVAMTNVNEDTESLIYAMAGMNVLLRKAIQHTESTCICDEGTTLFRLIPFARRISALAAHGSEMGLQLHSRCPDHYTYF